MNVNTHLKELVFAVHGEDEQKNLISFMEDDNYHWLEDSLELDEEVSLYGAVMAKNGSLVNLDDYITFNSNEYEKVYNNSHNKQ